MKSIWIPWLWPVFNQVFLMIFLSAWLRRSGVMTGAEWITFRFGGGRGAKLAHLIVVLFAILNVIGFLAYGFIGIGKFAAVLLPRELSSDAAANANLWALLITAITTMYVVAGGMFSVVCTEVLQFIVMSAACVWIGLIAMQQVSPRHAGCLNPGRMAEHGLRLEARPRLVGDHGRGKLSHPRRRFRVVRSILDADALQRISTEQRRTGPELRHAARLVGTHSEGSRQNERLRQPRTPHSALHADHRIDGPRPRVLQG